MVWWRFGGRPTAVELLRVGGEEQVHVDVSVDRVDQGRLGLDRAQTRLDFGPGRLGHEVELVQHEQIGGLDLILEGAFEIAAFENLLGVHDDHGHVFTDEVAGGLAPEVQLGVVGQGDARGLDHETIRIDVAMELDQRLQQIVRELAADTASFELDVGLSALTEQRPIDSELAELVRDQGDPNASSAGIRQQALDQGRLARSEEPRQHEGRDTARGLARGRTVGSDGNIGGIRRIGQRRDLRVRRMGTLEGIASRRIEVEPVSDGLSSERMPARTSEAWAGRAAWLDTNSIYS